MCLKVVLHRVPWFVRRAPGRGGLTENESANRDGGGAGAPALHLPSATRKMKG
jgi:hypothetical protein